MFCNNISAFYESQHGWLCTSFHTVHNLIVVPCTNFTPNKIHHGLPVWFRNRFMAYWGRLSPAYKCAQLDHITGGRFRRHRFDRMTKIYRNIYEFVIVLYASLRLQLIFTSCSRVNFFFLFVVINVIVKQLSWPGVLPSWLHDFVSFMWFSSTQFNFIAFHKVLKYHWDGECRALTNKYSFFEGHYAWWALLVIHEDNR